MLRKWIVRQLVKLLAWVVAQLVKLLAVALVHLVRQAVRHPRTSLGLAALTGAVGAVGWQVVTALAVVLVLAGVGWRWRYPASFDRMIGGFLRTWVRRWWRYRRCWDRAMLRCGLGVADSDGKPALPAFRKLTTSRYWDTVDVRMRVGNEAADFEAATAKLATAFKVERLTVRQVNAIDLRLTLMRKDPFREIAVPPAPIPETTTEIRWSEVPIGLDEHLQPLRVSVVGGHTLVSGAPNAGKAGLEHNILRHLAPGIADGTVRPVFIDPKRMELRRCIGLLHSPDDYANDPDGTVALLDRMVAEMEAAQDFAADRKERDFEPSLERPLRLICIDELAAPFRYWKRTVRSRIEEQLGLICTQGRASGHIVIGCIQEPTKDIFPLRDLFARRIGLRLPTESHTEAALCDDAARRGAACTRIPESMPGVSFVFREGQQTATRARLAHVEDHHLDEVCAFVEARRAVLAGELEPRDVPQKEERDAHADAA